MASVESLALNNLGSLLGGGGGLAGVVYFYFELKRLSKDLDAQKKGTDEEMQAIREDIEKNVQESICALRHSNLDETIRKLDKNNTEAHTALFLKLDDVIKIILKGKT